MNYSDEDDLRRLLTEYIGQSSFKTQRDKYWDPLFIGPTKQTKYRKSQYSEQLWKTCPRNIFYWFIVFNILSFFIVFFTHNYSFAFQSSFSHYFLIVRTIIFILDIIYLFESLCSWFHFDCHKCKNIFIRCWMKTDAWCCIWMDLWAGTDVWNIPKMLSAGI